MCVFFFLTNRVCLLFDKNFRLPKQQIRTKPLPQHHTAPQDLIALGLTEYKADLLSTKWEKEYSGLSAAMIAKTLTVNELVDMEW